MKFKLECDLYGEAKVTHEFTQEALVEVVKQFEFFLKGCGFGIKSVNYELPND